MTFDRFSAEYAPLALAVDERPDAWVLTVEPARLRAVLEALRPVFNFPEDLTCVDNGEVLRVLYRLYSLEARQAVHVQVALPRAGGRLPTAGDLWRGFDWQEREVYDLFGIIFDGHHDLRRILTWEGFQGHPLLKDYQVDNEDSSWQIPEQTDREILAFLDSMDAGRSPG